MESWDAEFLRKFGYGLSGEMIDFINKMVEEAYSNGYNDGSYNSMDYDEGYDAGYEDGKNDKE